MPNCKIHEKVGYDLSKKIGVYSYDYFLGLLAPDAPNLEGFAPREERWMAHERDGDRVVWRKKIKKFYDQEKTHYPKDFILGYYIHLLTDIVYDDFFYDQVREEIQKEMGYKNAHEEMREDMDKYHFQEWEEVKEILQKEESSYDILNISKERLKKWKEKVISQKEKEEESHWIKENLIKELEERVYEELKKV